MFRTAFIAAFLAAVSIPAIADECGNTTLPDGAKPLAKSQVRHIFSGKTWDWNNDGGGAYFSPSGKFVAINPKDRAFGKGTWKANADGQLCSESVWKSPGGGGPYTDCHAFVKVKDRYYDAAMQGDNKGKWWCPEAERQGMFGHLTPGDAITPRLAQFIRDNGL